MIVRNLVLEIGENESAAYLQARLDKAGESGFFLVTVVGRFAFLHTVATQPRQNESRTLSKRSENETPGAQCEANIRRTMQRRRRMTVVDLMRFTNARRYDAAVWDGAFNALVGAGEIRVEKGRNYRSRVAVLSASLPR
ncbi:MAG TPA: hypothetical protein VKB47_09885 [Terracidiphilus sp.]|nr:hypothetical protein [Terracidiphilus sp.]